MAAPLPADRFERNAVISGIGQSQVGRRIYRDPLDLTIDAVLGAIDDAGLTTADIDGIATYPGNQDVPPGFSGVGVVELQDALRLDLNWFAGGLESPGQLGSVINAVAAVATGLREPRGVLPHGVGGEGPGRQGPIVGDDGRRRQRVELSGQQLHAVDVAVRCAVGRELDRDDGESPLPRVRHDSRAAGLDRAQRPAQRRCATPTRSTAIR